MADLPKPHDLDPQRVLEALNHLRTAKVDQPIIDALREFARWGIYRWFSGPVVADAIVSPAPDEHIDPAVDLTVQLQTTDSSVYHRLTVYTSGNLSVSVVDHTFDPAVDPIGTTPTGYTIPAGTFSPMTDYLFVFYPCDQAGNATGTTTTARVTTEPQPDLTTMLHRLTGAAKK